MWPNLQSPADLVTFIEQILKDKLDFCLVLEAIALSTSLNIGCTKDVISGKSN